MDIKKYKVVALSVGALNNKIFNSGDIVFENNFREGRADELVKLGFLELIGGEKKKASEKSKEVSLPAESVAIPPAALQVKSIDEITVVEMIRDLTESEIRFKANSSKEELYSLWIKK